MIWRSVSGKNITLLHSQNTNPVNALSLSLSLSHTTESEYCFLSENFIFIVSFPFIFLFFWVSISPSFLSILSLFENLSLLSLIATKAVMAFRGSNASSGMGVAEHSKTAYLELQRKKVHRYVIFKIDEKKKEVVVEKTGGPAESYDDFTASLPENDCRYAIYDFDFVTSENCQKSKIFFIAWSPSVSRIRAKMLYATSKDRFRRELEGIHYEIQATDPTEMDLEVLRERAN